MKIADPNSRRPVPQGDVLFRRIDQIPAAAKDKPETPRENGLLVVAHSETGHHHAIRAADVRLIEHEPLVAYLSIGEPYADVEHLRPFDTHETVRLPAGLYEVRRQREHTPEGWRMVED